MKSYFFSKTQGLIIKLILSIFIIIPIYLLVTKYENKLLLVALIFFGFCSFIGILVVDDYTDKTGDEDEATE